MNARPRSMIAAAALRHHPPPPFTPLLFPFHWVSRARASLIILGSSVGPHLYLIHYGIRALYCILALHYDSSQHPPHRTVPRSHRIASPVVVIPPGRRFPSLSIRPPAHRVFRLHVRTHSRCRLYVHTRHRHMAYPSRSHPASERTGPVSASSCAPRARTGGRTEFESERPKVRIATRISIAPLPDVRALGREPRGLRRAHTASEMQRAPSSLIRRGARGTPSQARHPDSDSEPEQCPRARRAPGLTGSSARAWTVIRAGARATGSDMGSSSPRRLAGPARTQTSQGARADRNAGGLSRFHLLSLGSRALAKVAAGVRTRCNQPVSTVGVPTSFVSRAFVSCEKASCLEGGCGRGQSRRWRSSASTRRRALRYFGPSIRTIRRVRSARRARTHACACFARTHTRSHLRLSPGDASFRPKRGVR